jgi:hypothetical protein
MRARDWKNPKDYPTENQAAKLSRDWWAHEFLCCNQDFVNAMMAAKAEQDAMADSDISPAWNQRPMGKVLKEWGVAWPVLRGVIEAGGHDAPVRFEVYPVEVPRYTFQGQEIRLTLPSESKAVLEFDLSAPIAPQIARAAKWLQNKQSAYEGPKRKEGRSRVDLYPTYLRVLHALKAGANKEEMLQVFSLEQPNIDDKSIRNWMKEAKRLRDGGYRAIVTNASNK